MPLDDLSAYSEESTQQRSDPSIPLSGAVGSLEPPPGVVPSVNGTAPIEANVPSTPALDVPSSGTASAVTDPSDAGTTAPSDDGTSGPATVAIDCGAVGGFTISSTSSCYFLSDATFSWQMARSLCQAWGGDLVELGSPEENGALAPLVTGSVWTGANDEEQEGIFRWAGGGLLDYTAWAPNQPDNWEGVEDCGELSGFDQLWNDRPCTDSFAKQALCERMPESSNMAGD
jgi:hypothetical protein